MFSEGCTFGPPVNETDFTRVPKVTVAPSAD